MNNYDIIGDIHGCADELVALLNKLGYIAMPGGLVNPKRLAVFAGDLCDRGPDSARVLKIVMGMVNSGFGIMVMGNHDNKLMRHLKGNNVSITHGLDKTIESLWKHPKEFSQKVHDFLATQPISLTLDSDKLYIVHAAAPEKYQEQLTGKKKKAKKAFALYGITTGETDERGFIIREDWAENYSGKRVVVHGHVAQREATKKNNVYNVDTGCVYGNKLTALRYPEMEFVSVAANKTYYYDERLSPSPKLEEN